tara:strand:- start:837 stop:959 length:123 start_codon:yes stop_codon:yes gene_type:complete
MNNGYVFYFEMIFALDKPRAIFTKTNNKKRSKIPIIWNKG